MTPLFERHLPRLLVLPLALALAACGDDAADPATTPSATAPAAATDGSYKIDQPIAAADISTRLTLVDGPVHVVEQDLLEFQVEVGNDGPVALASDGTRPVQLGVTLAGPDGVDTAPGLRDFVRVRLPLLPAGESRRVTVSVPAAPAEGLTLRLELVQELVAWFGQYGQPTLDVGPFDRCEGGTALCDALGTPLPTR